MQAIERELVAQDWVTFVIVFAIGLLFLLKIFHPSRLLGYSLSIVTKGFIAKRAEENPSYLSAFHGILIMFSVLVISLLLFFSFPNLNTKNSFSGFLMLTIGVTLYFVVRLLIDFFITRLLGVSEFTRYFLLTKSGYLYNICIWGFPAIIVFYYSYNSVNALWAFFAVLLLVRFVLILINNKNLILSNLFYFILYLCSFEIAPLLILYRLMIK